MRHSSLALALLFACSDTPPPQAASGTSSTSYSTLSRADFNRQAQERNVGVYWTSDDGDNALEPNELAVLWGFGNEPLSTWVSQGTFTAKFAEAYAVIAKPLDETPLSADEKTRRELVRKELAQSRPTLVHNDFSTASAEDKAFVAKMIVVADKVEALFQKQKGVDVLKPQIPADDGASKTLFWRNQGPQCEAPATQNEAACSAVPSKPKLTSSAYPAELLSDAKFCDKLTQRKDGRALMGPFVVVRGDANNLKAVPYTEAYASEMKEISTLLTEAAAIVTDANEGALRTYLTAAAKAFIDNDWTPADEAWAKMGPQNSKWYLRVSPDETYFEPCSQKAGFAVTFAAINQASLMWQKKLDPVKGEMEEEIARVSGKPYKARAVAFKLPDFIDIIVNAGDSRHPSGAVIGQSLPNFGPVANEGRGRTMAMTNLYEDPDSQAQMEATASSLLSKETMAAYSREKDPSLLGTLLHEAAHNLGPAHQYKVKGKIDDEVFGGALASMLEELKAQTAASYFADWLLKKQVLDADLVKKSHVRNLTWAFGHISRGFLDENKKIRPYSVLAGIEVGFWLKNGAIKFDADAMAANGTDKGAISIDFQKLSASLPELMTLVGGIKARGDKALAERVVQEYVLGANADTKLFSTITERVLRSPKATFVYGVTL